MNVRPGDLTFMYRQKPVQMNNGDCVQINSEYVFKCLDVDNGYIRSNDAQLIDLPAYGIVVSIKARWVNVLFSDGLLAWVHSTRLNTCVDES